MLRERFLISVFKFLNVKTVHVMRHMTSVNDFMKVRQGELLGKSSHLYRLLKEYKQRF